MHLVIARLNHETNSFSPVPTPLAAFEPQWHAEAYAAARGSRTAMGAFLALAEEAAPPGVWSDGAFFPLAPAA